MRVKEIVGERVALRGGTDLEFDVAFCPEFLKEGTAVEDFMKPDRIVIGTENNRTAELLKELFFLFTMRENRMLSMSIPSAELTKYAANAMLATRISFMNELARFCELVGGDVDQVRQGRVFACMIRWRRRMRAAHFSYWSSSIEYKSAKERRSLGERLSFGFLFYSQGGCQTISAP